MQKSFYEGHKNKIKKIAIFRAIKLGDLLCSVPVFRALRHAFPQAEISLISLPWAEEFVRRFHIYLDRFIPFPGYPGLPEQPIDPQKIVAFLRQMQEQQFDLVLQMQGNGTMVNGMIELFGAKHTAGFYPKNHIEQYCPNPQTFMTYPETGHQIRRLLQLLEFLGIPLQGEALEFPVSEKDMRAVKQIQEIQALNGKQYICIHPGGISSQRWPEENFAQAADALYELNYDIILTGTSSEKDIIQQVQQHMKHPVIDLPGKTNLGTLGALLQKAALVMSNDTGVAHITTGLRTQSIVIFTNSNPEEWGPLDRHLHKVIERDQASVEHVLAEAKKLLSNHNTSNNRLLKEQYSQYVPLSSQERAT